MKGTEEKILAAATLVFARQGVSGATTREIAREACVNEVTLFRNFKNKDELLRRVIQQSSHRFEPVFADAPIKTAADLCRTIESYAAIYMQKLGAHEEFIRTFIGEMTRHPQLCRRLFVEAGKPVREKFIAYLAAAQKNGLVRSDLDLSTAADALSGMLLSGVMRRPLTSGEYEIDSYVKTCVKLYLKGIQP
jgi:AcrR family transcriptional regulator